VGRARALLFLSLLTVGLLLGPPVWISASALAARQSEAGVVGYRGDAARTGNQPGPGPTAAPAERWRFAVPFDQNDPDAALLAELLVLSCPVVADGVVYAGGLDGALYAIEAGSGAQRWRLETGAIGSVAAPVIADGVVFVGAQDGLLLAVDAASGEERWRVELGPGSVANLPLPAVADGVVYAGGGEGILLAVDAASGQERWQIAVGGEAIGAPVVSGGLVFVTAAADIGGGSAELVAVDATDGTERWRVAVGNQPLYAAPATDGELVYLPGQGEDEMAALVALEAASGAERWRYDTGGFVIGIPATVEGRVFVATNHALVGLDAATGQEMWRVDDVESGLSAPPPAIADGVVYVFAGRVDPIANTQSGVVVAVEAASGSERWRYDTGFAPSQLGAWDLAVAEGLVVVPGAGFILALG
jgi:outer membrane protein assembly factor BamB